MKNCKFANHKSAAMAEKDKRQQFGITF